MTLFAAEMHKIWRPLPILILLAMGALWTFVGIMPAYQAFTETERSVGFTALDLTSERRLINRYGPLTDQTTIERMKADIPRLERQATHDIQAHPAEAKTLGITDFTGYERWYDSIADGTFYPTDAPNTPVAGRTSTGARTAESAAVDAARRAKDPTAHMTEEQQRAMNEADRVITQDSEALQDLYGISLIIGSFPITQADAQRNLTNSVEMLRSTADTDKPVTPLQRQSAHDYQAEAANGWGGEAAGGCAAMDATGEDCTPEDASLGSQSYRVPGTMPGAVTGRLARYAADPGRSSYIQYSIVEDTWTYAFAVSAFAVIVSAAFTVPVMVRDRGRRMTQLQWASRSGRAGQRVRVTAVAVSSLIIGVGSLAAFGVPLAVMLRDFLTVPVLNLNSNASIAGISFEMSFGVPIVPWAYWTFGQYLAIIGATIVALTLAVTMLGAWLCRSTRSIIRMLLVMVPLLALVLLPARIIYFPNMFLMGNWLTNRLTVPGLEAWLPLAALLLAALAWAVSLRRLRQRELLR